MINVLIMNQADHNKQNQFSLRIPILVVHSNTEQLFWDTNTCGSLQQELN
jgi:hypothetical protein